MKNLGMLRERVEVTSMTLEDLLTGLPMLEAEYHVKETGDVGKRTLPGPAESGGAVGDEVGEDESEDGGVAEGERGVDEAVAGDARDDRGGEELPGSGA